MPTMRPNWVTMPRLPVSILAELSGGSRRAVFRRLLTLNRKRGHYTKLPAVADLARVTPRFSLDEPNALKPDAPARGPGPWRGRAGQPL